MRWWRSASYRNLGSTCGKSSSPSSSSSPSLPRSLTYVPCLLPPHLLTPRCTGHHDPHHQVRALRHHSHAFLHHARLQQRRDLRASTPDERGRQDGDFGAGRRPGGIESRGDGEGGEEEGRRAGGGDARGGGGGEWGGAAGRVQVASVVGGSGKEWHSGCWSFRKESGWAQNERNSPRRATQARTSYSTNTGLYISNAGAIT